MALGVVAIGMTSGAARSQCCPTGETQVIQNDFGERCGWAIGLSGQWAAVGAPLAGPSSPGGLRLLLKTSEGWTEHGGLHLASDACPGANFGHAVAIDYKDIVVGAPSHPEAGVLAGKAYVITLDDDWAESATLLPEAIMAYDQFGASVAIAGDVILVGAPGTQASTGSVLVFERLETGWTHAETLVDPAGAPNDCFGQSVAIDGDTILVGEIGGYAPGEAHVFRREAGSPWQHEAVLGGSSSGSDAFGTAVSIHGDVAAVGARFDNDYGMASGACYVFRHIDGSWTLEQKIYACEPGFGQWFGCSVAVRGDALAVGAHESFLASPGAAYVYQRVAGEWVLQAQLLQSQPTCAQMGRGLAMGETDILVGATEDLGQAGATATGLSGVLLYDLENPCPPDLDGDAVVDVHDLSKAVMSLGGSDPTADVTCDGLVDVDDVIEIILHWNDECLPRPAGRDPQ